MKYFVLFFLLFSSLAYANAGKPYPDLCDKQALEIVKGIEKAMYVWEESETKVEFISYSASPLLTSIYYTFKVNSHSLGRAFEVTLSSNGGNVCDHLIDIK